MRPRVLTVVTASQVCFVALLGVCVALQPGLVIKPNEGGVSNYGVHWETVVPYTLAYALDAGLLVIAARLLDSTASAGLRRVFWALSILLVLTLVSTYDYTSVSALKHVHDVVGAVLVIFEGACTPWLWRLTRRRVAADVGVLVTFAGLVLCLLATIGAWHVLFVGQVLVIAGYAPLLISATRSVSGVTPGSR